MDNMEAPTLPAYQRADGCLTVWCTHCATYHLHGRGDGHRAPHCLRRGSPYQAGGYVLQTVGRWDDLTRAEQQRKR
jgi:hypothetical protein